MSTDSSQITAENVLPSELFLPDQVGLNKEFIEKNGLELRDLTQGPVELNIDELFPMEESNGVVMLGILDLGGAPLKIHALRDENGKLHKDYITLSPPDYDPNENISTEDVIQLRVLPISGQHGERIIGRQGNGAGRLDLDKKNHVSRQHMGISIHDNVLKIRDLDSTNGTSLVTAQKSHDLDTQFAETSKKYEINVDGNSFSLEGSYPTNNRGDVYVLNSVDPSGTHRRFLVYKSNSEGGYRVSQGMEPDGRLVKGAENNVHSQYTQDTQLHPSIQEVIRAIVSAKQPLPMVDGQTFMIPEESVDGLKEDFERQVNITGWPHKGLNAEIAKTRAGYTSEAYLKNYLRVDSANLPIALDKHIGNLNRALEKSGYLPKFDSPERVEHDVHGSLGPITREVYSQMVGKSKVEWYMAYDRTGRVWIDRIRYADSSATPYGTDQKLIYSGILTSKPIDYTKNTTGLKSEYRAGKIGELYEDVSPFLDTFLPIKRFRAERGITRQ